MMKRLTKIFILTIFLGLSGGVANAQSEAMKNLRAKEEGFNLNFQYVYESMIRAVTNMAADTNVSDMTEGVRLVVIYSASKDSENYQQNIPEDFREDLDEEGFEVLMEMEERGSEFQFLKKGKGSDIEHLVILSSDTSTWMAIDVTGEIDLSKIMSLGPKKINELMDFF